VLDVDALARDHNFALAHSPESAARRRSDDTLASDSQDLRTQTF
jgi:hypothetical protein